MATGAINPTIDRERHLFDHVLYRCFVDLYKHRTSFLLAHSKYDPDHGERIEKLARYLKPMEAGQFNH